MNSALVADRAFLNRLGRLLRPGLPVYASGFLVGLCMVVRGSEWLIFVALLPMIYYVFKSVRLSNKRILVDFYVFGFIVCGFANWFLLQVSSQNWTVGLQGWFVSVATGLSWLLICGFCSVSFLVLGLILSKITTPKIRLLALPFLFPMTELLRSYMFAAMAYGPHGSFSPNFNWGSLAVPASGTPLVFASRFVNFFGLTSLVVIVNLAIFAAIKRKYGVSLAAIAAVVFVAYLGYLQGKATAINKPINISIVHLGEQQSAVDLGTNKWPPNNTDLLVLPEYSELRQNPDYKKILQRLSPNGVAATTERNGQSPNGTNRLVFLNSRAEVVSAQDKTFLIPTGETLPYILKFSFWLIRKNNMNVNFTYTQQITSGQTPEKPYNTGTFSVGALACSGVSALNEYSRLSGQGADVLVNSASLSFLQSDSLYHVYAHNMARYQAVSNNRLFVQASRSGESYIMDNQGR